MSLFPLICTWFLKNQVRWTGVLDYTDSKNPARQLDFSKLIFQKSSTDQQEVCVTSGEFHSSM